MATTGTLLTDKSIYGLINPPIDPSGHSPLAHQTINSGATNWGSHVDLSNAVVRLTTNQTIAGDKTFTGTIVGTTPVTDVSNSQIATTGFVKIAVNNLVNGAPDGLNTLNELAAAINDDNNYHGTVTTALNLKAPLAGPTFTGTPVAPTAVAGTNTTQLATTAFVKTAVDNLVDSAPGTLDTLNELAAALGDDANYATTVTTALAGKHPSITTSARLNADLIHDGSVSNSEFGYLSNVTSDIQTQIEQTKIKPILTIPEASGNYVCLNFTEGIKDAATYDKDDFTITNDGSNVEISTLTITDDKIFLTLTGGGGGGGGGSSNPDLASQVFSEDFEDDAYTGSVITAPITSQTGRTGSSTKVLSVAANASAKWEQTGYTTVTTISWWYKHISRAGGTGYILDLRNSNGATIAVWTTNDTTVTVYDDLGRTENLYINGVPFGTATYTLTDWNHFCITVDPNWGGNIYWAHAGNPYHNHTGYYNVGYIDDVRLFSDVLTTAQIADLAAGNNGNGGSGGGGSNPDLASQVFSEDFEDQTIVGSQTTATIVPGGINGTGYALQGDSTQNHKYWWQTTSDSLPNNVLAVSFWHYAVEEGSVDIPQLWRFGSSGTYFAMDLINSNIKYYISTGAGNIVKWYLDGSEIVLTSGSIYADTTLNAWHHHYFELNTNPTEIRWMGHTNNEGARYRGTGKLDDVRYFNAAVTTSQIADLAAGNNGNGGSGGGGGTSSITDIENTVIKYVKNATSNKNIIGKNTEIAVDSFRFIGLNRIQRTVGTDDLNITDISGLTVSLSGKQATIADGDLTIAKTNGLQAALDSKQATITDNSLTIARTTGLQTALDSKAPLANPTLTGTPAAPTAAAGTNTTQLATTAFVRTEVSNLVDSAPTTLDTLNELAAALGDDANFSTTMTNALAGKQATIADGDLTIARTNGLQAALDAKAGSTSLINLKPTMTIPEMSSGNILLNFTEAIKDVATYDKDDFVLTNEGTVISSNSISVENDKVKFAFGVVGHDWTEDTSTGRFDTWRSITSSADGTKLAAGANGNTIYTSSDSGVTWTANASLPNKSWFALASSADGTKLVAGVFGGSLWTSSDSGATWTENTTSPGGGKLWHGIASSADGTKLAAVVNGGNIYTSTDSGATWTADTSVGSTKGWASIKSSDDGTKLIASTENDYIWYSTNSGATWTAATTSTQATRYGITLSADGTKATAGVQYSGNIWTSTDGGATWTENTTSPGAPKNWYAMDGSSDGTKLVAAVYDGNIWTSTDSGATWTEDTTVGVNKEWWKVTMSADGTKIAAVIGVSTGKIWTKIASIPGPTITDVQNLTVKYTKSATANKNLIGKDSDVAVDSFDFIGTNRTQANITSTVDVSMNNLWVGGDISCNSTLKVDTINENTDTSGVTIDSVLLKDNTVTAHTITAMNYAVGSTNFISASRQGNFRDLEVKDTNNNATILLVGDGGDITIDGTLSADTIGEKTSASGVTIDSVLLKDNTVTAHTVSASNYAVGGTNFISASRQGNFRDLEVKDTNNNATILLVGDGGDITIDGTLSADTISEKTSATGVTIDGVLLKDGTITSTSLINLKPTITIPEMSSGNILLNFTEGIKDVATYDKDDFVLTNEGTVIAPNSISVENNKVKFAFGVVGHDWTEDTSIGSNAQWRAIAISADGTKQVAVASSNYIWTSTDSGVTWSNNNNNTSQLDWRQVASSSDGTILAASVYNGNIWISTNSGASWTEDTSVGSAQNWHGIAMSGDGTRIVSVVYGGYIWLSTNSGSTFTSVGSNKDWTSVACSTDGTKMVAVGSNDLWKSTDSGANWTEVTSLNLNGKHAYGITISDDGTKIVTGQGNGNIFYSTDSGSNWTEITNMGSNNWRHIRASSDGTKLIAATWQTGVWKSNDSGATWTIDINDSKMWYGAAITTDGTRATVSAYNEKIWTKADSVQGPTYDIQNLTVKYTKSATANKNLLGKNSDVAVDSFDFIGTNRIQATITDGDLTIARTNGLQAALDAKAALAGPTFTGTPAAPTAVTGTNTTQLATTAFVRTEVTNLIDSAPTALDTLNELAAALGDDANFSTTMTNALAGKQTTITDASLTIARTNGLQTALDSKQATITSSVDVSMNNLWVQGDISCNGGIEFKGHILPLAHETYDIGAADRKIRHLFLSDNSLWIGDNHKIDITGGKMKFKKRKTDIVPASILAAGGDSVGALAFTPGVGQLQDMQLHHWEEYARTLDVGGKGVGNALLQDIFVGNTVGDWEEDDALDDDIIISKVTGLQEALNGKQATIADGDLTIAKTAGLQTALDNAGGVKKPTMTIPELSSGNLLLNFTEPIKDLATYDKDDFVLTNEGTVFEPDSVVVENNKVRFKFSPTTHTVSTVAGMANAGAIVDGIGPNARFSTMFDMFAVGTDLYFDDSKRIRKMVLSTAEVTTLAGGAVGWPTDGIGSAVIFGGIHGVVSDGNNVYIADGTASVIRKLVIATGEVTTIAGTIGSSQYITGLVNGTGSSVKFNQPRALAIDSTGTNLYIGDYVNRVIRKMVLSTAEVTTLAGSGTQGSVDGTGTSAQFSGPWGIAIDSTDTNLYVADYSDSGGKIRKIVIATGVVTTLATLNVEVTKIVINSTDRYLYVTTRYNDIIVRIKVSDGTFITYGGQLDTAQSTDGTIDESRFNRPQSIAIDANDNIYVNEKAGRTIRKLTGSGGGPTITDVQNLTVTYTKSATVNENLIGTSPSSVAVDSFNFIGTNRTQANITSTVDVSMNNLWVDGDISCNSTLKVDTINENTDTSGVTIDSVLLKDNTVTAHTITAMNYAVGSTNFISASRQGNFRDLEVKDSGNSATILLTGDGGNISIDGTLSADTIGEQTSGSGVTIDSVLLKDQNVTAHTVSASNYAVGGTNFISASRQGNFRDLEVKDSGNNATILLTGDGGDISIDGTLSADTIGEKTSTSGVTIDGVLLKDNDISANDISSNDLYVDTINERTSASGVTIDGVLLKDNNITCTDLTASGTTAVATQSAGDNTTKIASTAFVKTAIDNLIDGAPGTLDTLKELSTALDNNNSYGTTITLQLAQKAPKADPTFTGTPAAPTANSGTNTTQLATTAFVHTAVSGKQDTLTSTGSGEIITVTERTDYTDVSNNAVRLTGAQTVAGAKTFSSAVTVGNYTLPTAAGTQGQVLKYPASGSTLTWGTVASGGGSSIDSTTDVSLNDLGVYGDLSCNAIKLGGHIIPDTNAAYDLGNAEYKIRHLFLSDNSLWIGDDHKIDISGGKMKFKKRKKTAVPAAITSASGSDSAALTHAGLSNLSDMKLHHWEAYAHTLSGLENANIQDIFSPNTAGDWDEDVELGSSSSTTTKKSQILETLMGVCDGRVIQGESASYTYENVTTSFNTSTTWTKITGSGISYKPPTGTKQVVFELIYAYKGQASGSFEPLFNTKLKIGTSYVEGQEFCYRESSSGYPESLVSNIFILDINTSYTESITNGKLSSWDTNRDLQVDVKSFSGYGVKIHALRHDDAESDGGSAGYFRVPLLKIVAIGEGTVGAVSNAVTTSGDQTIAGTKTFSNAIISASYTTTQRDALTGVAGMVIFNTTVNKHQGYNGSSWNDFY